MTGLKLISAIRLTLHLAGDLKVETSNRIVRQSPAMLVQERPKQIGPIARESGVPIKTIRYYEGLGLLRAIGRTEGGYRLFDPNVFTRLSFIKCAQSFGLSLAEIKDFLDVHD